MTALYGIKNCDKVRAARKWLENAGIDYEFVDIRETPLTDAGLKDWQQELGWEALVNKRSTTWKGLSAAERDGLSEASSRKLIIAQPTLMKRPVLVTGSGVHNGFTPASYEAIFKN